MRFVVDKRSTTKVFRPSTLVFLCQYFQPMVHVHPKSTSISCGMRPGRPRRRSPRVRKNLPPSEFEPRAIHPADSRYVNYVIAAGLSNVHTAIGTAVKAKTIDRTELSFVREDHLRLSRLQWADCIKNFVVIRPRGLDAKTLGLTE